jgi:hypothetical protein
MAKNFHQNRPLPGTHFSSQSSREALLNVTSITKLKIIVGDNQAF